MNGNRKVFEVLLQGESSFLEDFEKQCESLSTTLGYSLKPLERVSMPARTADELLQRSLYALKLARARYCICQIRPTSYRSSKIGCIQEHEVIVKEQRTENLIKAV